MEEQAPIEEDIFQEVPPPQRENTPYLIPGAIIVAGILIAGAIMYTNRPATPVAKAPPGGKEQAAIAVADWKNLADDDPILGNPTAPVTIVEFGDFQCPFCGRFARETFPQIFEHYIKTGTVKFVYRDFPLTALHAMAQKAAEAGECAHEQGKFWEYHDKIFAGQENLSVDNLKKWASDIGLQANRFAQCLDSDVYAAEVDKDVRDGQAYGIDGTPTSFVNGNKINGAVPFTDFQHAIENALKGK